MRMKTWRDLHAVGTSKVVNTSFIWLALIPFLSRCLDALHEGKHLPFNFIAFYYAAFFFTLASLIFNLKCPVVIKLTPTFGSFKAGGYSLLELKNWFHDMATAKDGSSRDSELIRQFLSHLKAKPAGTIIETYEEMIKGTAGPKVLSTFWQTVAKDDDMLAEVHDLSVKEAEKKSPYWRNTATVLYSIGFVLFGLVAILNLIVVSKISWQVLKEFFSAASA